MAHAARIRGEQPGPEASIRKVMADEHGQAIMDLAKDLAGAAGMLAADPGDPVAGGLGAGPLGAELKLWNFGFLFAAALTIGGGTGEVQRNILGERVLGLPHELDVESGKTWSEARRG